MGGEVMALPPILKDNLRLPVVASPLFIISHPKLTLAQCKAGIVGSFPALNARPEAQLDEWLAEITEDLAAHNANNPDRPAAPFAVNQIVHMSNKRLEHDLMMCVKYKVPIVISSLGAVPEVNAPLLLAGAIANGGAVLAAQAMGADMAYIGSPFIATEEARASAEYKQAIVDAHANDIVYSNYFTGIHGNYLKPSIVAAGMDPDNLPVADPSKMDFDKATTGAKAWKDIWGCGQGIGAVKAVEPVAAVVDRLEREYIGAKKAICG
jgi:nitronate monooxygenase